MYPLQKTKTKTIKNHNQTNKQTKNSIQKKSNQKQKTVQNCRIDAKIKKMKLVALENVFLIFKGGLIYSRCYVEFKIVYYHN